MVTHGNTQIQDYEHIHQSREFPRAPCISFLLFLSPRPYPPQATTDLCLYNRLDDVIYKYINAVIRCMLF